MNKKCVVLVVPFDGYQQDEYELTRKTLEAAGISVKVASNKKGAAIAKDGSSCLIDLSIEQLEETPCDGVFLIGGPGALENLNSLKMHHILKNLFKKDIVIGAICISPRILAQAGILKNKKATGWNDDGKLDEIFKQHQVKKADAKVVIDTNIITAEGPAAAQEFAETIVKKLIK
ncbi:DJ-1/PfpI family protein [bacterium]|nr:MAG: DJ-1/PfpI family protein [bacterium]QQR61434.1 MAG: DJ-1/PfpI family protein [bacterium]QQR63044.1 MAG: DJ-1/PfpI family protein [bacterium]